MREILLNLNLEPMSQQGNYYGDIKPERCFSILKVVDSLKTAINTEYLYKERKVYLFGLLIFVHKRL